MPEEFLTLTSEEQSQVYRAMSGRLNRPPEVLEKDVWVCWVLKTLFAMPGNLKMAFKGGTSLSKVFAAINRFSEDVDITIDYRCLGVLDNPFAEDVSKNRLKKLSEELKNTVKVQVCETVKPYFQNKLEKECTGAGRYRLEVNEDGDQLRVYYPTAFGEAGGYIGNSVLIEFGGRNITEPSSVYTIRPDISDLLKDLAFPEAEVNVLSPLRTFWEKATLMHVACQRTDLRASPERLSRHWYDVAKLADLEIGQEAIADRDLLADVIRHKKIFFNASYANYDACLNGQFRLIPDETGLQMLGEDYQRMIHAGMFYGAVISFSEIVKRLGVLETTINKESN